MVILFDEMKIQESLVWLKHTGKLIGFVNLGDANLNYATLDKTNTIVSHDLVFLIRSIVNPFKLTLANFFPACQLLTLFRKAVGICETQCNTKIVAATCNGASANREYFKLHFTLGYHDLNTDFTCRSRNFSVTNSDIHTSYLVLPI